MSDSNIENEFNELATKVKNSKENPSKKIDDNIKLLFYIYYKQATIGDCNTPQPNFLDFTKRSLWDGWNKLKGTSKEDAMKMYIYYANQYV